MFATNWYRLKAEQKPASIAIPDVEVCVMSARLTISDDVSAILDRDGAVILDTRAGKYYSLNRVAADVWRGIEAGHSLDDVVADLASRYDQTREHIAGDVNALVASLQRLGLVGAN